ncbi:hypothetical protein GCM10023078_05420 [Gibbsiella greigii]
MTGGAACASRYFIASGAGVNVATMLIYLKLRFGPIAGGRIQFVHTEQCINITLTLTGMATMDIRCVTWLLFYL